MVVRLELKSVMVMSIQAGGPQLGMPGSPYIVLNTRVNTVEDLVLPPVVKAADPVPTPAERSACFVMRGRADCQRVRLALAAFVARGTLCRS